MPSKNDGMQPMQMQTSAGSSGGHGLSAKPIIVILSAVVLGLLALVVGGGVAVYKVIQTHHMNSDTLQQLKSVESMVQQLKSEQKTLMNALIDKEKELEDADFVGDSAEAEKKEEEMEKILDEVIEVEDEIEEEEEVEDEIEDELHANDAKSKDDDDSGSAKKKKKKNAAQAKQDAKEMKLQLNKKVAQQQEAILKKEAARKEAFPILAKSNAAAKKKAAAAKKSKQGSRRLRGN